MLPEDERNDQGGDGAAKGDGSDHIHAMVEGGTGCHMVGPHHEGNQQKCQKTRQGQGRKGERGVKWMEESMNEYIK